ncbi:hypothetical protein KRP22_014275 [Phytophthora ramorum]|nr:hypothetical protein KRP22_9125 [Phytophthora ramorum]
MHHAQQIGTQHGAVLLATRTRWCQHRQTEQYNQSASFLSELTLPQPSAPQKSSSMWINRQLSPRTTPTASPTALKQDDDNRRTESRYRRQRQAMRAPLLPVSSMAMARGNDTAYTVAQGSTPQPRWSRSRKLSTNDLPPEAAALKRRIWDSHPRSVYKFRLSKMTREVIPPVEIPAPLSDPTLLTHMVSGKTVPMTSHMWQQQRELFKLKRLPNRIREGIAY